MKGKYLLFGPSVLRLSTTMTVNIGSEELISIKRVLKSPKRLRQHLTHRTFVHQCGKTWYSVELNCWLQWVHVGFVTKEVKTLFVRQALTEATLPLGFDIQYRRCHFIHNPWVADMSEWVSEWVRAHTDFFRHKQLAIWQNRSTLRGALQGVGGRSET